MSELANVQKPRKKTSTGRVISPKRAISLYSSMNGGPVHTREILALCLREGQLRCRATNKWVSHKESLSEAWKYRSKPKETGSGANHKYKHLIKKPFWWRSACWLDDVTGWDFSRGRMYITLSVDPPRRIMLSGVVFHGGDVKKALVPGSLELVKGSFKKLKIIDQWRIFWHELFMLATNNGELASQSALADIASDDKAIGEIRKKLAEEAEFWADNPEQIDAELASFIASRSRLSISDNTVIEEIKALRQTLRVKRSYNAAKKRVISN